MKISYNWLKEFINLELTPKETAEKLTLIGLEVEEVVSVGNSREGVIIGEILEVSEHTNADRLVLCQVDLGDETVQIVCGADNVAAGQKVPVATVGSTLEMENGESLTIKKAKLRGEESSGMICSEKELGFSDDHSGIMVLNTSLSPGTPLREAVKMPQDHIIEIEITPNRPDATSHVGVARDLAAALNLELNKPYQEEFKSLRPLEEVDIKIESPEKCHRYVGKMVKDIEVKESPAWLKNRLQALDIRPVNNVVDVTNYVLLEMGQPLHAFDADTIKGNQIVVKDFDEAVDFETLDHIERTCSPGTLFICDADEPLAIAGVMGGVDSEVSNTTQNILIESAYFDPVSIRQTAKEQVLQTDASYRFERGTDPQLQRVAAERAAELIMETAGGAVVEACTDVHPVQTQPEEITLRQRFVNRLLGTDFSLQQIMDLLIGLELEVLHEEETSVTYAIPTFRPDLTREVDLVEEVGRLYDYNNIPSPVHSKFTSPEPITAWEKLKVKAREAAKGMQFREIYSNSLMPEEDARLLGDLDQMIHTLNPISKDTTTLRPSLLYGFLKAVDYNFNRKASQVRFFEVGNVFEQSEESTYHSGIKEETHILFGIAGYKTVEHWKTEPDQFDVFDLKGPVENFLQQLGIFSVLKTSVSDDGVLFYHHNKHQVGRLFRVSPDLLDHYDIQQPALAAELSLSEILRVQDQIDQKVYQPVSKFPSFEYDFAVIVDASVRAGTLLKTIQQTAGASLKDLQVFDVFEGESLGEHKKSIAFRLSFLDKNKTLTIKDVQPIINKIVKVLEKKYSAKLRS